MGHDDRRTFKTGDLRRIGAAMSDLGDHARGHVLVSHIPQTDQTAHNVFLFIWSQRSPGGHAGCRRNDGRSEIRPGIAALVEP
ncbi:hypothetical protein ACX3P0_14765 [Mesorhizobium sp. A556]